MKPTTNKISFLLLFSVLLIMIITRPSYAEWAAIYGGSKDDYVRSIHQTSDGGYIVAGYTRSFGAGSWDIWVLKLDSDGNVQWQKTYGTNRDDRAESIQQTADGGYTVAGRTNSVGGTGNYDFWVLKLDANGNVVWQKTYGNSDGEVAESIYQTSDTGYIVAGNTRSFGAGNNDFWVLKLNANGTVAWQKTYGGSGQDYARSIEQTSDGGYIVAGYTNSFGAGNNDFWVLKLDSSGAVQWQKTYGGSKQDYLRSIHQTSDGGYIAVGSTNSFGTGAWDIWVLKLDSNGTVQWQRTYGGSRHDYARYIQQTTDGGYIVAGDTLSFGAGFRDFCVLKLNSSGNIQWQKTYGGSRQDYARSIQQTSDGGYAVAGYTRSFGAENVDFWVLKLSSNGTLGSCNFVRDANASVLNSNSSSTNTSASVSNTTATPQNSQATVKNTSVQANFVCHVEGNCLDGIDNDGDGLVDCEDPDCCGSLNCFTTNYSEGSSSIKFKYTAENKDKASLRMCINSTFCNALRENPEALFVQLNGCTEIFIPGDVLQSNKDGTKFSAKSPKGETPRYSLKIDCAKGTLRLSLKNADLKNCVSNPVKTCIYIIYEEEDGPCFCAEEVFERTLDKEGNTKSLSLSVTGPCPAP